MKIVHKKFKVHSLTGRITPERMRKAFKAVKRNRGVAGLDRVSIKTFEENLDVNLDKMLIELKSRNYHTIPLKREYIPKGSGKAKGKRPLGIPSVRCRVAQEVVRSLISPTFEKIFHPNSFGFRPGRSCHQAILKVKEYLKEGYKFVVDADIKGFFDNISHTLIEESVAAEIADGNILNLVCKFLKAGVMEEGELRPTIRGTPQGGVISPILGNIALNHLDWQLEQSGFRFVRYADDFVILCKTEDDAKKALAYATHVLNELGLELSPEKTKIVHLMEGFNFLGFFIKDNSVNMREKSIEKFKEKIRILTIRSRNLDQEVIEQVNRMVKGTINYFCPYFATTKTHMIQLIRWTRKRIRCMWKKRISRKDNIRLGNKKLWGLGLADFKVHINKTQKRRIYSPT